MAINRNKVLSSAQKHTQKKNWDKAIREYQKLVEDDPRDLRSQLKIADLHVKSAEPDLALEAYRQVAYHYFKDEIYDKAIAIFKMAIGQAPEDPQLRRDLGESYHRLGRLRDALREFNAAQRVYRQRSQFDEQRDVLESMVRIDPEDVGLRVQLAERYEKDGMRDEAIGLLQYAATMLEEEGRNDEFLRVAERIIYLKPSELDLRKKVARIHINANAPKRALKHLQYCFKTSPRNIETLKMLSQAFSSIGQKDKAALVYRELAHVYREQGQTELANETYRQVLKLNPDDAEAHKMLAYEAERRIRQAAPKPVPVEPQVQVSEVEFLDDDLEDVLGQMRVQGGATTAPSTTPQKQPPAKKEGLLDFARDELGGLAQSEAVDALPLVEVEAMPILDAQSVALVDDEQELEQERDVKQVLDECEVFLKYGLHNKAIQSLQQILERVPDDLRLRERLVEVYQAAKEPVLAVDQLFECAKLVKQDPAQVHQYIDRAGALLGNPSQARMMAEGAGLVDPAPVKAPEPAVMPTVVAQDFGLMEDSDLGNIFNQLQTNAEIEQLGSTPSSIIEKMEFDDGGVDFLGDFDEIDITTEFNPHDAVIEDGDTGEIMLSEAELLDIDAQNIEFLDDSDLLDFTEEPESSDLEDQTVTYDPEEQNDITFDLNESEAESMFDELFDDDRILNVQASFSGAQDLAGIAEIDFLIDQGMMEEAEDALNQLQSQNPTSQTLENRKISLQHKLEEESEGTANSPSFAPGTNPFGSRSLSQNFQYNSVQEMLGNAHSSEEEGVKLAALPSQIQSTNFDLGISYSELGLYDEAMEEFRQALQDPQAGPYALYNLALCETRRGSAAAARSLLRELLAMPHANAQLQSMAQSLMDRVS